MKQKAKWMGGLCLGMSLCVAQVALAQNDWRSFANLKRYEQENTELLASAVSGPRVVFMGDSITEMWTKYRPDFFANPVYVNRGISGQTTPQMLVRFRSDVLDLKPEVVVILAGTNDIAGNTGDATVDKIAGFIMSMSDLAAANGIKVVLCSVLPAIDYLWYPGREPAPKIIKLNSMLREFAEEKGFGYVDYHSAMVDDQGGLKVPEYTSAGDLVHPNAAGYEVMEALVVPAVDAALGR